MAATSAFLAASALPPAARTLLFQPAGAAVGGRVLLLKGAGGVIWGRALLLQGTDAGAGPALVAGPRRAVGDGDSQGPVLRFSGPCSKLKFEAPNIDII